MSKSKEPIVGREVYVLSEVIPYEGSELIGIFVSAEAAMKDRQGKWKEVRHVDGEHYFTTAPEGGTFEMFYTVESHIIRAR